MLHTVLFLSVSVLPGALRGSCLGDAGSADADEGLGKAAAETPRACAVR